MTEQNKDLKRVEAMIEKGETVLATHKPNHPGVIGFPTLDSGAFSEWQSQSLAFLCDLLEPDHVYIERFGSQVGRAFQSSVKTGIGILKAVREDLKAGSLGYSPPVDAVLVIEQLCDRFHLVVRQLRHRSRGRTPLHIEDEYDVQYLLHALLWIDFEDVRVEEYTPSYAGKSSRLDFLLKQEQVVVEAKKTRLGLDAKELGTQLVEDIARYEAHHDCQTLVCFVYDPEAHIANPRGIEADLSREEGPFPVRVFIRPA